MDNKKLPLKIKNKEAILEKRKKEEEKELIKLEKIEAKIETKEEIIKNKQNHIKEKNLSFEKLEEKEEKIGDEIEELEEKEKEKRDEIEERKEELYRQNDKIINDFSFIISQNKVIFTDKITKKEIKEGGKYSQGVDYHTGESVQILDKDYGKSAELMRALLETESVTPLWKRLLILFIILITLFGIGIVIFSMFSGGGETATVGKPITNQLLNPTNQVDTSKDNQIKDDLGILPTAEKTDKVSIKIDDGGGLVETAGPLNNLQIKTDNQIEVLKKDYEIESLKLELNRIMEEKNLLTHENFRLSEELTEKDGKIEILENKLVILEEKGQDLTQDGFLLFLGSEIYKKCENSENEGVKNNCKDLYYKYLKNDKGLDK